MGVPLLFGERMIGMITLDKLEKDFYTPEHAHMAQAFATQAATAIENARLFDETQRLLKITEERAQELAIINSVQAALAAKLDFQAIVDLVGDKLREVLDTGDIGIRWYDSEANLLQYLYEYEHGERLSFPAEPPAPDGQFDKILKTHKHLIWDTVEEGNMISPNLPGTDASRSGVSLPIISSDRIIGNIIIENYERDHAYGESELRLLTTISASLGTALENARLFDETQRLLKITEERAQELAILNSVGEAMAKTLDVKTVTRIVGDKVRDIFGAEVTEILLQDPNSDLIQVPYAFAKDYQEVEPFAMGEGLTSKVILSGKPLVLGTFEQIVELGALTPTEEDKTESYMGVPIVAGEKMLGVVSVQSYVQNAYNENDVRLLQTLSSNMGVAIANARLFDETQRLLKITEERNAELAVINSVQAALAAKLDMQSIYDAVGDKIQEIFDAQVVDIGLYDPEEKQFHFPYIIESGERFPDEPMQLIGFRKHVIETRQPFLANQDMATVAAKYGNPLVISGQAPKSSLYVPMLIGGVVKGIISLQNVDRENAFTESDVRLLTTLTNAMSVALENARLFDETQRLLKITEERAQELAVINSVQAALAAELNIQGIYDAVGDKIREIFNQADVDIRIYDPKTNLVHYPYMYENGERIFLESSPPGDTGFEAHIIRTRETLVINENMAQEVEKYGSFTLPGTELEKSAVFVPLVVGDQARGMVDLVDMQHEHAFSESDVRLLTTLANAMSVALENARLFDETQRLLKVTEERAAELGAISKVSQALIVESELDSTIQLIGSQMREIFSADIVYLALLNPQTNLIHFPYQYGESFEPLTFGEGLTSNIIRTGEPLLINQNLNERAAEIGATRVGREALSYLGVPIKTGKGTIGVISVQSTTQEGIFTDDSLRLLTTIAANAGAALHNAQLFSEALENLRQVEILTNAANAIEQSAYEPAMVESVAARTDALGELARVFAKMADEVRIREQRLKRQLAQMQLDIEEKKLAKAETVAIYIPMDRRQAMAQHVTLPERAHGAALFADVSGFTALTESLANELGLQRGAEEMIRHLNRVFTVLIDEVHRYSGAVISFSGDAITCWFDDLDLQGNPRADSSLERAAACAFAMQKGMMQFSAISTPNGKTIGLSIKVALAVGPARRMAVGDGSTHQIDVLAGATLTALANAEHESDRGEVVLATANLTSVEEKFNISAWREEKQFAVLTSLKNEIAPSPWAEIGADAIIKSRLRSWMHPTVFEKVRAGQSEMLSELRPATALFMKFGGLDYDNDPQADKKLNAFMQWVEGVIAPHNGSIIQFTVGDKGSYIYIVFGAPIAHRDDAAQAVFTALELASPPESLSYMTDLFIGLASGQMRVGAYGGAGHRTYGAIGDRTNLAARLMVAASKSSAEIPKGQRALILCNDSVYEATQAQVEFESMPPINVKGKTETIAIYRPLRKMVQINADSGIALELAQLIDNLSHVEQLTLKVASVIGHMFTLESLSSIYPEEHTRETLQAHLNTFAELDLIQKRPNESSSYNFKDPHTHEAAYNLMLFAQRRQLHRAVAELLEQNIFSVPPYAEIAQHWKAADEIPKAIEYLEKAGEHAHQMGDFEEASRFFNESLALNK